MIISDSEIIDRLDVGSLVIEPMPSDESVQPTSVDLHLSPNLKYFGESCRVEVSSIPEMKDIKIDERDGLWLRSDQFFIGSTLEWIEVPRDLAGVVDGKSSLGRMGLAVHVTAGYIDPGFRGNITLELKNLGNVPIILRTGMAICQIRFHPVRGRVIRPYGSKGLMSKYQNSAGTVQARPVK